MHHILSGLYDRFQHIFLFLEFMVSARQISYSTVIGGRTNDHIWQLFESGCWSCSKVQVRSIDILFGHPYPVCESSSSHVAFDDLCISFTGPSLLLWSLPSFFKMIHMVVCQSCNSSTTWCAKFGYIKHVLACRCTMSPGKVIWKNQTWKTTF